MADATANHGWVKCTDDVWRRPDDYLGQQLPVPPLAVQPVREWPDHPTYRAPGPHAMPAGGTDGT